MSKDTHSNLYLMIITILGGIIVSILSFWLYTLVQTVDIQSEKIAKLEKNLAVVVTVVNTKMPNANLPALMTMSAEKNISQEQLSQLILMFEKNPTQAKTYLENQLHFDSKEMDAILKPTPTPNKNTALDSPP